MDFLNNRWDTSINKRQCSLLASEGLYISSGLENNLLLFFGLPSSVCCQGDWSPDEQQKMDG